VSPSFGKVLVWSSPLVFSSPFLAAFVRFFHWTKGGPRRYRKFTFQSLIRFSRCPLFVVSAALLYCGNVLRLFRGRQDKSSSWYLFQGEPLLRPTSSAVFFSLASAFSVCGMGSGLCHLGGLCKTKPTLVFRRPASF